MEIKLGIPRATYQWVVGWKAVAIQTCLRRPVSSARTICISISVLLHANYLMGSRTLLGTKVMAPTNTHNFAVFQKDRSI